MKPNTTIKILFFVLAAVACGIAFYLAVNFAVCSA